MAAYQDWDRGLNGLREIRPDLADRAATTMATAETLVAKGNFPQLPQTVVHGDVFPGEYGDG
jgi:homoserine kinase type II